MVLWCVRVEEGSSLASVYPWVDKRRRTVIALKLVEAGSPKVCHSFSKCVLGLGYYWSFGEQGSQAPCPHAASIVVWRDRQLMFKQTSKQENIT